jgi:hypothetical protein
MDRAEPLVGFLLGEGRLPEQAPDRECGGASSG